MKNVQDAELLRLAMEARLSAVHTALPGVVVSYDPATQTADVRPTVTRLVPTSEEGVFKSEALPVVPHVPVLWPRGGASWFAPGLSVGEGVLLVCCESDPASYIRTGSVSDPGDVRRHSLAHAVAIPGFGPRSAALPPPGPTSLTGDAAALASKLDMLIQILVGGWVPVPLDGGEALKVAVAAAFPGIAPAVPTPFPGVTTGSHRLKLED